MHHTANSDRAETISIRAALIGRGIAKSRTPAMHMEEGRALKVAYDYRLFDTDDDAFKGQTLANILHRAESENFAGLNVTFPYKFEVMSLLDGLSENARNVGAVNTIVLRKGKRLGHNTDLWGFAESFRRGMADATTDDVLLIGAGGAGVSVAFALLTLGVEKLRVFDVQPDRATALASALTEKFGTGRAIVSNGSDFDDPGIDGVVNATPVGMDKFPGTPFPKRFLRPEMWVADIVYFPLETQFLQDAREIGCRTLPGSGMAVFQAVRAFKLITGIDPDAARMRRTFDSFGT